MAALKPGQTAIAKFMVFVLAQPAWVLARIRPAGLDAGGLLNCWIDYSGRLAVSLELSSGLPNHSGE